MSHSTEQAKVFACQLERFITLNPHQLAEQIANLDFWLTEVRHALAVIDGYGVRFVRLHAAQEQYVAKYHITVSDSTAASGGFTPRTPSPVRRVSPRELSSARRALIAATTQFLDRCRVEGLLTAAFVTATLTEFAN
jgi:hypothetical protein